MWSVGPGPCRSPGQPRLEWYPLPFGLKLRSRNISWLYAVKVRSHPSASCLTACYHPFPVGSGASVLLPRPSLLARCGRTSAHHCATPLLRASRLYCCSAKHSEHGTSLVDIFRKYRRRAIRIGGLTDATPRSPSIRARVPPPLPPPPEALRTIASGKCARLQL